MVNILKRFPLMLEIDFFSDFTLKSKCFSQTFELVVGGFSDLDLKLVTGRKLVLDVL